MIIIGFDATMVFFTFLAAWHCLNLCMYFTICCFTDMANKLSLSLSLSLPLRTLLHKTCVF